LEQVLYQYLPEHSVNPVIELLKHHKIHLKIVNERKTRHGDYRKRTNGQHQITVNATLNKYRFLMTLIHEMAHLKAFEVYGRAIKPHGLEWKHTFTKMVLPFLRPEIFPNDLLPYLARHFRNPTASSDTDPHLARAMKKYDVDREDKTLIHELPNGSLFRIRGGRVFQKVGLKVKRYACVEVNTGRMFLFNANAEVEPVVGQ
jgi:hypothetical protein